MIIVSVDAGPIEKFTSTWKTSWSRNGGVSNGYRLFESRTPARTCFPLLFLHCIITPCLGHSSIMLSSSRYPCPEGSASPLFQLFLACISPAPLYIHNVGGCVCVCTQEVEHCFDRSLSDRCCHRVAAAIAEDARLGRVRVTRVLWYLRCHHRAGFTPVCIVGCDFRGRIGDNRGGRELTREYRRTEFDVV